LISNHQDDLDFGIFLIEYYHHGVNAAETKWVAKRSVSWIPFFGWVHWLTGDLFLKRSWDKDQDSIRQWLAKFGERGFKRIVIFPEGTRIRNKKKLSESQEFAKKNDLPLLHNVLYPRTKGFSFMAKFFRDNPGSVDYVYDYTVGYYPCGVGIEKFLQGPIPVEVHIHVTRHLIADIGKEESDFAAWCIYRFQLKDKLLDYFDRHHKFPSATETRLLEKETPRLSG